MTEAVAGARQATLDAPFVVHGPGLHTGVEATMEVRPAPRDAGLHFIAGERRIPALAEFARESELATVITDGTASVSTVEHILAALVAMGVTNADIAVDGPEVPILDGCASAFVGRIRTAGIRAQEAPRPVFTIDQPVELRDRDRVVIVMPADRFRVHFVAQYAAPIGTHYLSVDVDDGSFDAALSNARTFAHLRDVEAMRSRGLARGGTLENALVYDDAGPMTPLRWPDEVVRHKILDLIGDFALLGAWPQCEIVAIKSGHAMHARVTRLLRGRTRA